MLFCKNFQRFLLINKFFELYFFKISTSRKNLITIIIIININFQVYWYKMDYQIETIIITKIKLIFYKTLLLHF